MLARVSSKALRVKIDLPLVFLLSVLPDVDIILPSLTHRGITHSFIVMTVVFVPLFFYYRKKAAPYYLALAQHVLIGDILVGGGVEILWPLARKFYGLDISLNSQTNMILESSLFILAILFLILTKDILRVFTPDKTNFLLILPEGALLGSAIMAWHYSSFELLSLHCVFLVIFGLVILGSLKDFVLKHVKFVNSE